MKSRIISVRRATLLVVENYKFRLVLCRCISEVRSNYKFCKVGVSKAGKIRCRCWKYNYPARVYSLQHEEHKIVEGVGERNREGDNKIVSNPSKQHAEDDMHEKP